MTCRISFWRTYFTQKFNHLFQEYDHPMHLSWHKEANIATFWTHLQTLVLCHPSCRLDLTMYSFSVSCPLMLKRLWSIKTCSHWPRCRVSIAINPHIFMEPTWYCQFIFLGKSAKKTPFYCLGFGYTAAKFGRNCSWIGLVPRLSCMHGMRLLLNVIGVKWRTLHGASEVGLKLLIANVAAYCY